MLELLVSLVRRAYQSQQLAVFLSPTNEVSHLLSEFGRLTYKAINYTLNQWSKLVVYAGHHELRISNIMAENAIRPFVVGRKAWLFADTSQGAKASAVCYSLVETAKLNGLEPYSYLHTLLTQLPYAETLEQIEALLPWNLSKN